MDLMTCKPSAVMQLLRDAGYGPQGKDIAPLLGVTPATVSRWGKDERTMTQPIRLLAIALVRFRKQIAKLPLDAKPPRH